ncbi:MAG: C25 family cysteine peptidase, partial [Candidatus Latescibacterota bacterium]
MLVGLPPSGPVRLELVEARVQSGAQEAALAAPVAGPLGGLPVHLGEEGLLRGLRVVPVRFSAGGQAGGAPLPYEEVVADLHLPPSSPGGPRPVRDRRGEDLLRHTVANWEQARSWRRPAAAHRGRPAVQGAAGPRVRIAVRDEGLYRISGADLEEAGVALRTLVPARLRLLYGGGRPLPAEPQGPLALEEVALRVEDGSDGRFDAADYVLFYGEPVSRWVWDEARAEYRYLHNVYTHDNTYWLDLSGERPSAPVERRSGAPVHDQPLRPDRHRVRRHEESEQHVQAQTYGISSGYEWYWEDFHHNARAYPTLIHHPAADSVRVRLRFLALDQGEKGSFRPWHPVLAAGWNGQTIGRMDFVSRQARVFTFAGAPPVEGNNRLLLVHENYHTARLDWYELEYWRALAAEEGELYFDMPPGEGVAEYRLSGFPGARPALLEVWGAGAYIVDFEHDAEAGIVVFQDASGARPRRYAAVAPQRQRRPLGLQLVGAQDLLEDRRGAEYLVVTHADFRAAAERLAAWRARDDRFGPPLSTRVVDIQDLYDAFSGGLVDPAALRNFIA